MPFRHHHSNPSVPSLEIIIRGWLGAAGGMGLIATLSQVWLPNSGYFLTIGSFGASSVLLFAITSSPYTQPRNLFGGHLVSAIVGVSCYLWLGGHPALAIPLAVATAILAMQVTRTLHPPGGATALIAIIGPEEIHAMGFAYLIPVLTGVVILFVSAYLSSNLFAGERRYPAY
jgi:CBS-domain-containing membrane protein